MDVEENKGNLIVSGLKCINLAVTLDCGQAFRWREEDGVWHAVAFGKKLAVKQEGNSLIFYDTAKEDFDSIWCNYFDLSRDYDSLVKSFESDAYLKKATEEYYGIRVLNQEPWEALCSFIISQNNNIPRIKGIIERLCLNFGDDLGDDDYTFPSAQKLSVMTVEDLSPLRAGFRAKYIIDAAKKVSSGEIDFGKIISSDIEFGREELKKICGVGPKVAECALLYGCKKAEAFPIDVWVKRIMKELYPDGLPSFTRGFEGIAQQYLFHLRRNTENV